jgi:hypothetical protein
VLQVLIDAFGVWLDDRPIIDGNVLTCRAVIDGGIHQA